MTRFFTKAVEVVFQLAVVEPVEVLGLDVDGEGMLEDESVGDAALALYLLVEFHPHQIADLLIKQAIEDFPQKAGVFLVEHLEHEKTVVGGAVFVLAVSGK